MAKKNDTRPFPIQQETFDKPACVIPWWLAEVAYKVYAKKYQASTRSQSLQRLAERGGFGREELVLLIQDSPNI